MTAHHLQALMDSMQDLANLTTNETPTRPEMDDSNPTRTPGLICPLAILLNEGWMNRLPGDERSQTNIMPLGVVTNDSYPTEWYSQHGIAALLRVQQEEEVLQVSDVILARCPWFPHKPGLH